MSAVLRITDWACENYPAGGANSGSYVFTPVFGSAEVTFTDGTTETIQYATDTGNYTLPVTVRYIADPLQPVHSTNRLTLNVSGTSEYDYIAEMTEGYYAQFVMSLKDESGQTLYPKSSNKNNMIYGESVKWTAVSSNSDVVGIYYHNASTAVKSSMYYVYLQAKAATEDTPVTVTVTASVSLPDGTEAKITKTIAVTVKAKPNNLYLYLYPPDGKTAADVKAVLQTDYGVNADYINVTANDKLVYLYWTGIAADTIKAFNAQFGSASTSAVISITDYMNTVNSWFITNTTFGGTKALTAQDVEYFGYEILTGGEGVFSVYLKNLPGEGDEVAEDEVTLTITYMNNGTVVETISRRVKKNTVLDLSSTDFVHSSHHQSQPAWYYAKQTADGQIETDAYGYPVKGTQIASGQTVTASGDLHLIAETSIDQNFYFRILLAPDGADISSLDLNSLTLVDAATNQYRIDNTDTICAGASSRVMAVLEKDYLDIYVSGNEESLLMFMQNNGIAAENMTVADVKSAESWDCGYAEDGTSSGNTFVTFVVSLKQQESSKTVYTVDAVAGKGGTITPAGSVTVNEGSDVAFSLVANTGYKIVDVKVDGISVGAVSTYTFTNVAANHTIEAVFEQTAQLPETGDNGGAGLWLALLTASSAGLIALGSGARKRRYGE